MPHDQGHPHPAAFTRQRQRQLLRLLAMIRRRLTGITSARTASVTPMRRADAFGYIIRPDPPETP